MGRHKKLQDDQNNLNTDNQNLNRLTKSELSQTKTNLWEKSGSIYKTHFEFRKKTPNPAILEEALYDYLDECKKANLMPTELGFCLYTGLRRNSFNKEPYTTEPYRDVIEKMRMIIEEMWIQKGLSTKNSIFHIFGMKNMFAENWKDKKEVEENKTISINLVNFNQLEAPVETNIIDAQEVKYIDESLNNELNNES